MDNTGVDVQTPAPGEDTFTLGDKRVETNNYDRFKGRKNLTARIAIVSKGLIRAYTHFYEGGSKKTTFRCLSKAGNPAICCQKLGDPRQEFGMVLFEYATDPNDTGGTVLEPNSLKGKVRLWKVSETRFEELSAQHKQWPLLDDPESYTTKQHDLIVKCTEEQYQKMIFTVAPQSHWKSKEGWYKALKAKEVSAKQRLKLVMGRTMSETELMDLFGMSSGPAPTGAQANAGEVDLSDVLDD